MTGDLEVMLARLDERTQLIMDKLEESTEYSKSCFNDHEGRLRFLELRDPGNPTVAHKVEDHENRLRILETFQLKAAGALITISVLASTIVAWLLTRYGGN
jgi:hypothetical protein